ncbi:hypothetical protein [Shewanella metallivivens]|uniref:Uncharacterized protein n=1 Tax=Shewanella metallivivens TaxID=2872342 RepID=A0ABT5TIY2_9GAMM|nr:hypothetical protein [Shewanella metallivivens]MDD8058552.1 hypothetical protein [Shewanella metallivivens]
MAVWQVPIEFVPAKWAEENNFEVESLYGEDGFDTTCAWIENQPTKDLDTIFSPILPKVDSKDEDLSLWGNDKVHDISVWHEEGEILSIGFRLDLRENIISIMSALCEAATSLNCVLFVPGQKVILNPNVFELKQYILKSNAAKYVNDPEGFLNGLSE